MSLFLYDILFVLGEPEIHFKAPEPVKLGENATFVCTVYESESGLVWESLDGKEYKNGKKYAHTQQDTD